MYTLLNTRYWCCQIAVLDLLGSKNLPKKYNRYILGCCISCSYVGSTDIVPSCACSHIVLIVDPCLVVGGGTPNNRSNWSQTWSLFPITASPEICTSNNMLTSWRVILHSPLGKANVWRSGLHLITITVITCQFNRQFWMRTTLPKPHSSKSGNNKSCGGSKFITLKYHQDINLKKKLHQN
jgi:hypothetical protein